jgi:hypothetical protein
MALVVVDMVPVFDKHNTILSCCVSFLNCDIIIACHKC